MRLDTMLEGCAAGPMPRVEVSGLQYDSRKLRAGEAFFAFPGERVDGHEFIQPALRSGAAAIVSERVPQNGLEPVWARVAHGRQALALGAARFHRRPDRDVRVTAVTGTNGKTTTVHLIDSILRAAGRTTAMLGTIEHRVGSRSVRAVNTTPESLDIVRALAQLREIGGTHATMEASSHALALKRFYGIEVHTAVFTNLTRDHLDFHGDMERYGAAKLALFQGAGARAPLYAVVNADDAVGRRILGLRSSPTLSYGRGPRCDVRASGLSSTARGLRFDVATPAGPLRAESSLVGDWNVENLLAAIGAAICQGLDLAQIESGIRQAGAVPGRFESVDCGQPFLAVVDYAHTDDALRRLAQAARRIASAGAGRVITVFGCGGDRDRSKRAPMGHVAGELSDLAVVTSDNPRSEDPLAIIRDVVAGLRASGGRWTQAVDRAEAIATALRQAREGDVVLVAGKGHETTQVLADRVVEFDDRAVVRRSLKAMGYQGL